MVVVTVTGLGAALAVEARKATASRVVRATTVLLVVGVAVLAGSMTLAAEAGNEQVLGQLGPLADQPLWLVLTGTASQIAAAGGVLAFGVVLSWSVGREFTDGTVTGLFATPVSRPAIALAKLTVLLVWSTGVAASLVAVVAVVGLALGMGPPDPAVVAALARLFVLVVLSGLIASPAAWAATLGRGLLPGIAASIGVVVVGQVTVVAGTGAWLPIAAPALWATSPADVSVVQLALVLVVPLVSWALTLDAWARLQLDR